MQGAQGRGGGSRQGGGGGYTGRGGNNAVANNIGAGAGVTYGGMPAGYVFNNWMGYNNYHMQSLMPMPPVVPRTYGRGSAHTSHAFVPLGVQGAGILKRPSGPPSQGQSHHGRSRRHRGHGGDRSWSRDRDRDRKNLTKEALDADLDEYRMKDKKFGGQSLDAELDEYWKKKDESENLPEDELKDAGGEGSGGSREDGDRDEKEIHVATGGSGSSSRHSNGDTHSADGSKSKGVLKEG